MSTELGRQTINNLSIYELDTDPSVTGFSAEIGSLALLNASLSDVFFKYGGGDNDWQTFVKKSFFQAENTEVGQDLNSDVSVDFNTIVSIFGTVLESGIGDFTQVGESVQINFTGFVRVTTNLHVYSTNKNASAQIRLKKNTVLIGPVGSHGSFLGVGGQQESSVFFSTFIPVVPNDIITINSRREGAGGTVVLSDVGTSQIIFERY